MERCATRPQSLQEGCSSSCESSTNACYTQMYSQQSGGQGGGTTQYRSEEGRDARDEAKPEAAVIETAPVTKHKKKHYH
jgi:hypothetical protein